jgi:uncharacterized protein YecE (DUF72 family)
MGTIRIGISGWDYDAWRGDFYPPRLRKADQLAHAASVFDTIEVNGTFYGLVTPSTVRHWREQAPSRFVFAVKGSRYITHTKKLKDPAGPLANFLAQGVLELDEMLGPILWQLPGNWRFDAVRVEAFLTLLPHDTEAAGELARQHDDRVAEPAYGPGTRHRLRHVLEVRDPSFLCDGLVRLARRHGVALAFSHAGDWPYVEELTAGWVYVRLHGTSPTYASPYGEEWLRAWARRVRRWADGDEPDDAVRITDRRPPPRKGRDVYVYFDNDQGGHAPREAAMLRRLLDRGT